MALAQEIIDRLGAADADRLPPGVRARAEHALADLANGRAPGAATPRVRALADIAEDDLLSRVSWLALAAHDGNRHDESPQRRAGNGCGCVVGAAALGAVTVWDAPGHVLVGAVALGLELQQRLARAMGPAHRALGWDAMGTAGPPAAAAAATIVAGGAPDQVAHAIGIATSLTLGHGVATGTGAGGLHIGSAAANGLLAASLAMHGSTATITALEGPRGYFQVLGPDADPELVLASPGGEWLIDDQHQESTDPAVTEVVTALRAATTPAATRDVAATVLAVIRGEAA